MRDESDARLIAGALAGDERAFRRLVERHHALVYSVVRGVLGERHDAEDVVQEVLLKMYRGLSGFRGESRFTSWLYRIARNEALNAATRYAPPSEPVEEAFVESPPDSRPDVEYERAHLRASLERHLGRLDETYRTVLELRYLGEKSYVEIAEIMDLPLGTVKTYIYRAKAELKKALTREAAAARHGSRGE